MILKEIAEKEFGDNIGGGFIGFYAVSPSDLRARYCIS